MARRRSSKPMNAARAAEIKRLWRDTDYPQHVIASMVGVNQGRVCEVVTGKRFADVPPALSAF